MRRTVTRSTIVGLVLAVLAAGASWGGDAHALSGASVIVEGVSGRAAADAVGRHGGRVVRDLPIVDGVSARVPRSALAALAGERGVRAVTPDGPLAVQADASPVHEASAVFPEVVGADRVWKGGWQGAGVAVAVVDTGIAKVGDLAGRVKNG
ncbi:MAG TPA: hypothetical protein VEN99_06190, partial [Acidimicrobiia bacterium]|nr:hypothetical protein [Acidimicrobiia bacterium]